MNIETYFEKLSLEDAHENKDTFFQSLYSIVQSKQYETPSYTLFLACLMEAYCTPFVWTEEEETEMFSGKEPLFALPTNDLEELLCFIRAEADYFGKITWSHQHIEYDYFADEAMQACFDISELFYIEIVGFLEEKTNQELFTLPAKWSDFTAFLKKMTAYQPLQRLHSRDGRAVLHCLLLHQDLDIPKEELGGIAWIAGKWQMVYTGRDDMYDYKEATFTYKIYPDYCHYFQTTKLNWWKQDGYTVTEETRIAIRTQLTKLLERYFSPKEVVDLIEAGKMFYCAYPEVQGIGNADGYFYEDIVSDYWERYMPYCVYFEAYIGKNKLFDNEWITLSQILWQHYRWTTRFSEEAVAYFLQKAVQLEVSLPVHYFTLSQYQANKKEEADEQHALQSNMGVTYFYYAEFLYYDTKNYTEALAYYEKFVALEPCLLPNNLIEFNVHYAMDYTYPPSVQIGLMQIAKIYHLQNDIGKAKEYAEKAIVVRENNYQTPYQLMAEILEKEGNIQEAVLFYEQKARAMEKTEMSYYYGKGNITYYLEYEPAKNKKVFAYFGEYQRAKVVFLHDFYFKIANLYNQLQQPKKAEQAHKKGEKIRQLPKHHYHEQAFRNL